MLELVLAVQELVLMGLVLLELAVERLKMLRLALQVLVVQAELALLMPATVSTPAGEGSCIE